MRLHNLAKDIGSSLITINEEDLKKLHKLLLIILDDLIEICSQEEMRFALIGGTAIGALRHKGFVPWDDDIDIVMPRQDFNKLVYIIRERYGDKYYVLNPADPQNHGRIIPKLGLKGTEYRTALARDLDECGVFIDVYVIENVPDHRVARRLHGMMALFCGYALSCRRLFGRGDMYKDFNHGMAFKIKSVIGALFSFASLETWARWTDYWHSNVKNDYSKYISIPADGKHYFGGIHERNAFCNFKKVKFEGRDCYVPGNYDEYLRGYYGDYMQMPPPEKRERSKYIAFDVGIYKNIL